jgi:hypothetical protein
VGERKKARGRGRESPTRREGFARVRVLFFFNLFSFILRTVLNLKNKPETKLDFEKENS